MPLRTLVAVALLALLSACATTETINKTPEARFQEGEDLFASKHYEDAIAEWKRVKESYANPELTAQAELKIADAQFLNESYIEAAASYEDFRKFHPKHPKAPYALFRLAMCNYKQIGGVDTDQTPVKNTVTLLESFLDQYPKDEYAAEAREKLQECRMKQLQHELYVARFYLRTEKFQAAIKRLEEALTRFPGAPLNDETLYYLGQAYIRAGEKRKGREALNRLSTEYPNSPHIEDARKFMDKYY